MAGDVGRGRQSREEAADPMRVRKQNSHGCQNVQVQRNVHVRQCCTPMSAWVGSGGTGRRAQVAVK